MNIYLLFLAIFPGLAIVAYIYWRDRHEREPRLLLLLCFLFGIASTYPAIKMEEFGVYDLNITISHDPWMTLTFSFVIIAFSEELVKFIFLRYYLYPRKEYDEPMDGIVYSVVISMGFATLENVLYVLFRAEDSGAALEVAYSRMFTAVPAHASFAIVMGYYVGLAKFTPKKETLYLISGLFWAIVLHGLYDFFLFQKMAKILTIFTSITLILSIVVGKLMIHWHLKVSPHERKDKEILS